jgi:ATP-dependent Lon protease
MRAAPVSGPSQSRIFDTADSYIAIDKLSWYTYFSYEQVEFPASGELFINGKYQQQAPMNSELDKKFFTLKIFYLKRKVIFPSCTMTVALTASNNSREIKKGDKLLTYTIRSFFDLLFYRKKIATLSEVLEINSDEKQVRLLLKGLLRVRVRKIMKFKDAQFKIIEQESVFTSEDFKEELRKKSQELIFLINVEESDKLINLLNYIVDLNQMTDFIANYFIIDFPYRYRLYNELDTKKRGEKLIFLLDKLIEKMNKREDKQ